MEAKTSQTTQISPLLQFVKQKNDNTCQFPNLLDEDGYNHKQRNKNYRRYDSGDNDYDLSPIRVNFSISQIEDQAYQFNKDKNYS